MSCGGTVTEFNTKNDGIPLRDVWCLHFHDKVHQHVLIYHAPTPHWGIAKSCHCNWGWRKDQGQWLSVLTSCSIASTARRKLISLLYCQTFKENPIPEVRTMVYANKDYLVSRFFPPSSVLNSKYAFRNTSHFHPQSKKLGDTCGVGSNRKD